MKMLKSAAVLGLIALGATGAVADTVELFGQAEAIRDVQISPDGARVAMGCSPSGEPAVCIYGIDEEETPRLFAAADEQRITGFYWASDRHLIANVTFFMTLPTTDGARDFEMNRAISFDLDSRKSVMLMQQEKGVDNLTDLTSTCDAKPDKVMMELTFRAADDIQTGKRIGDRNRGFRTTLYSVDLDSGRSRKEDAPNLSVVYNVLGADCEPHVRVIFNDLRRFFRLETAKGRRVLFEMDDVGTRPMYFEGYSEDKTALVFHIDHPDYPLGLHEVSLDDGSVSPLMMDGEEVGNRGVIKDRFRDTIIGFTHTNDLRHQVFIDPDFKSLHEALAGAFSEQVVRVTSWSRDRSRMTLAVESEGVPAAFYLFDGADGSVSPLGQSMPQLEGAALGPVLPLTFAARDGMEIPSYLTLPPEQTVESGPFPLVVLPHGGPESRDTASFDWWAQAYAAEGYAVLQPNFRGSSGYGAAFRNAGYGEFGGAMIDDIVDGAKHLMDQGIARPEGACIAGGSYGGYAALMAPLKPDAPFGCAVAINAVTNIFSEMGRYARDGASYNYWAHYVGGDVYDAAADRDAISPAARASEYDIPVLLIHGREDLTVEFTQSTAFEAGWGDRPGLRFVKLDGVDHYLAGTESRSAVLSESLAFLEANHPAR